MNKTEFIRAIGKESGISQRVVRDVLNAEESVLYNTIGSGEDVVMFNGLKFRCVEQAERNARNPRTGETIVVPQKKNIKMKASKRIKDIINGIG